MNKVLRKKMFDEMGLGAEWLLRGQKTAESAEPLVENVSAFPAPKKMASETIQKIHTPNTFSNADKNAANTKKILAEKVPFTAIADPNRASKIACCDFLSLEEQIKNCASCAANSQIRAVFAPTLSAEISCDCLFISDAPSAAEESDPLFSDLAGALFEAMLQSIGLKRGGKVIVLSAIKCHPTDENAEARSAEHAEINQCRPFLERQIALLQPKIIVLLGSAATFAVLKSKEPLKNLRGKAHFYQENATQIPVIVTYHPAYLLRSLPDKAKSWEDLCRAQDILQESSLKTISQ